jgi:hypothetical protein
MATIHQSVKSLLDVLALKFGDDFRNLGIRNYGFQAPGLLDPNKNRSGYYLRGAIGVNRRNKPITVPVLLGKIAPIASPSEDSEVLIYKLAHSIALEVAHWQECEGVGLTQDSEDFAVRFEITREQDRNVAGNNKNAWWWVVKWQFDLVGYFDA